MLSIEWFYVESWDIQIDVDDPGRNWLDYIQDCIPTILQCLCVYQGCVPTVLNKTLVFIIYIPGIFNTYYRYV